MDKRIVDFLDEQRVATICCIDENNLPYCFSCFYAFDCKNDLLYFKSNMNTQHVQLLLHNNNVAGTINPDKLNPLAIKGVQFTGALVAGDTVINSNAHAGYHKKYPFALAMPGTVWAIRLNTIKMTDNTLSFGKKIQWSAEDTVAV